MLFTESVSAHRWLDGLMGIEIGGAANNPFNIPGCIYVDYTDDMTTIFKNAERESAGTPLAVDVVAPGDALPFGDATLDYVLSSHVFEHFWDPIAAIKEWIRVLKPGGIVYMIVPHKERTFDAPRPRTRLVELIQRHSGRIVLPPDADPHGHHSVWITEDVVELITYLGFEALEVQDTDDKVGNGFTIVFRKPGDERPRMLGLDLGCGNNKRAGTIGIDKRPGPDVDIVLDLNDCALPFADDSILEVYSNGLFPYLADPVAMLREIIRVCQRNAIVQIWTPHGANDNAMLLGSRHAFTNATWFDLLQSDRFADCSGNLTFKEIVLLVPSATIAEYERQGVPLDFAIRHHTNVVSRIGALLTVRKPHAVVQTSYVQRTLKDDGA